MIEQKLLNYVLAEKEELLKDIEALKTLPQDILIEKGLLLTDLVLYRKFEKEYQFTLELNNSKLKPGDLAIILIGNKDYKVTIIENLNTEISIESKVDLNIEIGETAKLKIDIPQLLDPIISTYEKLLPGMPGYGFLEVLFGIKDLPKPSIFKKKVEQNIINQTINDKKLSEAQIILLKDLGNLPYLSAIQGPPGTGKSFTIAKAVEMFNSANKRILVICHTHQAVNNCLLSINHLNKNINLIKIGNELNAIDLPDEIKKLNFTEYHKQLKAKKIKDTTVVGMTIYSAIVNIGLRNSLLNPNVVIVDEAGQIPLTIGALLGFFGASTNLFFGDDQQMPPIFNSSLKDDELSLSVFQQLRKTNHNLIHFLDISYRMNEELTNFISNKFYLDNNGIPLLKVSDFTKNNKLKLNTSLSIPKELLPEPSLLIINDASTNDDYKQENPEEAKRIAEFIVFLNDCSYDLSKIAVVTPFRKQVNNIKYHLSKFNINDQIIVDTVERIQGITVDIVFVSLVSTDKNFISKHKDFIYSKNRLNVAISRARLKVIIFGNVELILSKNEII